MQNHALSPKLFTLDKRLKAFIQGYRQNIALLGDDCEEIAYLLAEYSRQNQFDNIISIHASTLYGNKKDFLKTIAFSLLSGYSRKTDTVDNLIYCLSPSLVATTDCIKNSLKNDNLSFLNVVEVINTFITETNMRCVLFIEEFLRLKNIFDDFYQSFSKFIILQRNCMIVLTDSLPKEAYKVLTGELNLLFGNFEIIFINETNFLENFMHLRSKFEEPAPSAFFISFFVKHLGTNTLYYTAIAEAAKRNYRTEDEEGSILATVEHGLFNPKTYLYQRLMRKVDFLQAYFRDYTSIIKLLLAMSEGYLRKKELLSLHIYDSKELHARLQKLSDINYVENLGNIYKLKDPLFSFWITHVFKLILTIPDSQQRRRLFHAKLQDYIRLFKEDFSENTLTKVLQLLSSFKNDTVYVGKKRYRLPFVEKTKMISYPQENLHLFIGEGKEIIFAGIKEKNVNDSDIFDFIEKGANVKGRGVKKVFIALDTVSPTAKLIAKNNKLTIWDVNDINRLLHIYNKAEVPWDIRQNFSQEKSKTISARTYLQTN